MNRGDRREPIVGGDHDRQRFLETLGEDWVRTDSRTGSSLPQDLAAASRRWSWRQVDRVVREMRLPGCDIDPQCKTMGSYLNY
jgi:hypothetical protein